MRRFRQLTQMLDSLPEWARVGIAVVLVAYSFAAIYGRINLDFGARAFSKIPREEIRSNVAHIVSYTVIPVAATIVYLALLIGQYTS